MQGCVFLGTRSPQLHHPVLISSFILVGIADLFQLGLDELRCLEYSRPYLLIYVSLVLWDVAGRGSLGHLCGQL